MLNLEIGDTVKTNIFVLLDDMIESVKDIKNRIIKIEKERKKSKIGI